MTIDDRTEWLETDGLGGFASGTTSGIRTRRYHALLLTATTPPTGRMVLVNGFDAWIETPAGQFALSTQRYAPDVLHPDGTSRLMRFSDEPWPTWEFDTGAGVRIVQELFVEHGVGTTVMAWRIAGVSGPLTLHVRPFVSGRDYHSMHHENGAFRFDSVHSGAAVTFTPYDGVPAIAMLTNGDYRQQPEWYRNFLYTAERERGLDDTEDLASPGIWSWSLTETDRAVLMMRAGAAFTERSREEVSVRFERTAASERRRRQSLGDDLDRAADAYIVQRGDGRSIVAGYPWFTDWGRDTFIAMRGLVLARGKLDLAASILADWADAVSQGMLPNRFTDASEAPQYNAVDASLWFVVVVHEYLASGQASAALRAKLGAACDAILDGYSKGTRYRIAMDTDGLLACGEPGVQLTWMDAKVGDRVITPRIGKPVEVQALWINALRAAGGRFTAQADRAQAAFDRFWNAQRDCLFDVIDADHIAGRNDASLRPNQIFAVGGLPRSLLSGERARAVVDVVERTLVTPAGLRSLAPSDPEYRGRYEGGPEQRDGAYHQGTVWPWLMGPFVEAWLRVKGDDVRQRAQARARFVAPLANLVGAAGIDHVCEIADGDAPHIPRGCPFQAWSLGELIRVEAMTN